MLLKLVRQKYVQDGTMAITDIDEDDTEQTSSIMVNSPTYRHISGVYKVWKYGNYGYMWEKKIPNTTISYILFFSSQQLGNVNSVDGSYIYIYCYDTTQNIHHMEMIAQCCIIKKNGEEICRWYIQDKQTLHWNHVTNINYQIMRSEKYSSFY